MGFVISTGTPLFIWTILLATYPELPSVKNIDTDLWSYLLFRVILFSVLLVFSFIVISALLKRYLMMKVMVLISLIYLILYLYFRWEWL
jgi:hypothetical protein